MTYTQEQVNILCKSYADEVSRLLDIKASLVLANYNQRKTIEEQKKQIEELTKTKEEK